jgi:hypothetical protein
MTLQDQRDIDETIEILRAMSKDEMQAFMIETMEDFARGWLATNPSATEKEIADEIRAGIAVFQRRMIETAMLSRVEVAGHA